MKKKVVACFIAAMIGAVALLSSCAPVSTASLDNFIIEDGVLLSYTGTASEVVIPEGVTSIAALAFEGNKNMETLRLSATVEKVEENALADCVSLNEIVLSKGMKDLRGVIVKDLSKVTFVIPDDMDEFDLSIFYNKNIQLLSVDEGNPKYKSVENVLFTKDMKELVYFPIGNAQKNYVVPDSVERIGATAFKLCRYLESVTLPESIEEIGEEAFTGCISLKTINLPSNLKKVARNAFAFCRQLTEIVIPEGVTVIEEYAFDSCQNLQRVVFPSTLETIGKNAFRECMLLETATFPDKLKSIGEAAFLNCVKLESYPSGKTTIGVDAFKNTRYERKTQEEFIISDDGILTDYNGIGGEVVIPEGVVDIRDSAFENLSIRKIVIPSTYQPKGITLNNPYIGSTLNDQKAHSMNDLMFEEIVVAEDNPYLTVVDGVLYTKDLSVLLFYPQGKPDKEFVIPDHVTQIAMGAFYNCFNLESLYIPDSVERIGDNVFHNCTSLTEVRMPEDIIYWGETFSNTPFAELNDIDTSEY